jgi:2-deoxy-D-gluconate 3-dehydrogenase
MSTTLFDLSGKTALITGGNGGIGYGIAKGLADSGANIIIAARDQAKTEKAVGNLSDTKIKDVLVSGYQVDVSDEKAVNELVDQLTTGSNPTQIDILVNNAGINIKKPPMELSTEEWNKVVQINLTGSFLFAKAVYPNMKSTGGGKIINIGSMTSVFGVEWAAAYASTKGGVVQLTKSLAVAWARDNIQVNTILPGWITTDLTKDTKTQAPERYTQISSRIPQNRWGDPDDLAGTAIFLSSNASDYVTGVSIPVDGGYTSF